MNFLFHPLSITRLRAFLASACRAIALFLPLGLVHAEDFAIKSIEPTGDTVTLHWENGSSGPFQVQYGDGLDAWSDLGRPVDASPGTFPTPGDGVFYRVNDLGSAGLGSHLGQLQVMQGEFGEAFERHRLKSLWDLHLPADSPASRVPSEYFRQLVVRYQHISGNRIETIIAPIESFPNGAVAVATKKLTFTWRLGEGAERRSFTLVLDFPYTITQSRTEKILVSDPFYTLTCRYATPQPLIGFDGRVTTTREDEVDLVEIGPSFWDRDQTVRIGAVRIHSQYSIGLPIFQGSPPFIFKTPILQQWNASTTITGLTAESFELTSEFSRSYFPGHHNFVETLYLEPQLEPGIDPDLLDELRAANIRVIIPFNPTAFPNSDQAIQILGFDGKVREL